MFILKSIRFLNTSQPMRYAIKSALSLTDGMPEKAIAFPGAKSEGALSHLSKLAADHLRVAFDESDDE
mgnify:FL=1